MYMCVCDCVCVCIRLHGHMAAFCMGALLPQSTPPLCINQCVDPRCACALACVCVMVLVVSECSYKVSAMCTSRGCCLLNPQQGSHPPPHGSICHVWRAA